MRIKGDGGRRAARREGREERGGEREKEGRDRRAGGRSLCLPDRTGRSPDAPDAAARGSRRRRSRRRRRPQQVSEEDFVRVLQLPGLRLPGDQSRGGGRVPPVQALLGRQPEPAGAARARRGRRHGRGQEGAAPEAGQPGLAGRERRPPDGASVSRAEAGPARRERTRSGSVGAGRAGRAYTAGRWGAARPRPARPRVRGGPRGDPDPWALEEGSIRARERSPTSHFRGLLIRGTCLPTSSLAPYFTLTAPVLLHTHLFSLPQTFPDTVPICMAFISVLPKGPRPLPENSSSPFLPHPLGLSMASSDIFEFHRLSALCGIFFFSNLQELAVRYFSNCFPMKTTSHVLYSPHPMAFSLIHWAFIGLPFFSGQPWCLVF